MTASDLVKGLKLAIPALRKAAEPAGGDKIGFRWKFFCGREVGPVIWPANVLDLGYYEAQKFS